METIGDAYMVVGGAPDANPNHAVCVADLALAMLNCVTELLDPFSMQHLRIRIGQSFLLI